MNEEVNKVLEATKVLINFCDKYRVREKNYDENGVHITFKCDSCPFFIYKECRLNNYPCDMEQEVLDWFPKEEITEESDVTPYDEYDTYDV